MTSLRASVQRQGKVFGVENVFENVHILESKSKEVGEIDVLVIFANRSIVVQAKSKKLTIEARKGNDLQLKDDFKKAVQDACDQACACGRQVLSGNLRFVSKDGTEIKLPNRIAKVHPVCVVADHYPALSFQAHTFLKFKTEAQLAAPLICDVFLIDTLTEMLETPLRCLSYLELRALVGDKLVLSHEHTALGYHLKQNLWLGDYDYAHLDDSISADLDVAMAVRRDGIKGERTPPGVLTHLRDLRLGQVIDEIEGESDPGVVEIGLELLKLGGDAARDLSDAIDTIAAKAAADAKEHDATILVGKGDSGITVHCNKLPDALAARKLKAHCELRKYSQRAARWFGLAIAPGGGELRLGLVLDYPWEANSALEEVVKEMPKPMSMKAFRQFIKTGSVPRRKVGRNEPCICGSGRKYKKCCLGKS